MGEDGALLRRIRVWLAVFIVCLVLSGLTAFPLVTEVRLLHEALTSWAAPVAYAFPGLLEWMERVREGLEAADGMIACAGIIPLALICGPIRGIPFGWTVIDMSFGVYGVIPLLVVRRMIKRLEALTEGAPAARAVEPAAG
ncbi:hypothetical protein [Streptomyces wuyuanensis]|uniref:hypothetical protein n=1 Tax=Streptomyces wuyuanensis TaxID=1196353 RepID=UPI003714F0BF